METLLHAEKLDVAITGDDVGDDEGLECGIEEIHVVEQLVMRDSSAPVPETAVWMRTALSKTLRDAINAMAFEKRSPSFAKVLGNGVIGVRNAVLSLVRSRAVDEAKVAEE